MKGARQAGIRPGAFTSTEGKDDAGKQSEWFLKIAGTNPDWMPHALDIEESDRDGGPADKTVKGIIVWLKRVSAAIVRQAVIYVDPSLWRSLGDPKIFHQHPLWIAD